MRNGLVQLGAWAAATGAAVAVSWLGVHTVLAATVFEPPRAVALPSVLPAARTADFSTPPPQPSPEPSPGIATPTRPSPSPSLTPSPTQTPTPAPTPTPSPSSAGSVHSYLLPGGRVALDLRSDSAELVSATPDPGWQMQVWHGTQWMRIDFSSPGRTSSVFVTWNGHPPNVQTVPAS